MYIIVTAIYIFDVNLNTPFFHIFNRGNLNLSYYEYASQYDFYKIKLLITSLIISLHFIKKLTTIMRNIQKNFNKVIKNFFIITLIKIIVLGYIYKILVFFY